MKFSVDQRTPVPPIVNRLTMIEESQRRVEVSLTDRIGALEGSLSAKLTTLVNDIVGSRL